ncbi:hypothetical protein JW905_06060 [bacterium]|nr:hypothetical protein [candidate division CSSED10-310 bacterium]
MRFFIVFMLVLLILHPVRTARAAMELPTWHIGDWWEIRETIDVEVAQVFPGSEMTITDTSRYTITGTGDRTQTKTGKTNNVYVMEFNGNLTITGTIIMLGIPTNVRVSTGVLTGEQWNRVADLHVVMTYRRLYGSAEAESATNPGEWEPLGPLTINLYEEYDEPIPYGFPLEVGKQFDYSLQNHMFGDFTLETAFGTFSDDFYEVSDWSLYCSVLSMQTNECQFEEPGYYLYADHIQDGVAAIQEGWVEPRVKWYNKVELTRFAHPLGTVRSALLCLEDTGVQPDESPDLELDLRLNAAVFTFSQPFQLTASLTNPGAACPLDLYVVLDISALTSSDPYFVHPSWRNLAQGLDCSRETALGGVTTVSVLDFVWPQDAGAAAGLIFWGVAMEPDGTTLYSDIASAGFSFN